MTKEEAILKAKELIEYEEFSIKISQIQETKEESPKKVFQLRDERGCNLGNIESRHYDTLAGIIDDLDMYHNDYVYPLEDSSEDKGIPEYIAFLGNDEAAELLLESSPADYEEAIS